MNICISYMDIYICIYRLCLKYVYVYTYIYIYAYVDVCCNDFIC